MCLQVQYLPCYLCYKYKVLQMCLQVQYLHCFRSSIYIVTRAVFTLLQVPIITYSALGESVFSIRLFKKRCSIRYLHSTLSTKVER